MRVETVAKNWNLIIVKYPLCCAMFAIQLDVAFPTRILVFRVSNAINFQIRLFSSSFALSWGMPIDFFNSREASMKTTSTTARAHPEWRNQFVFNFWMSSFLLLYFSLNFSCFFPFLSNSRGIFSGVRESQEDIKAETKSQWHQ